jgi:hypothetical protein
MMIKKPFLIFLIFSFSIEAAPKDNPLDNADSFLSEDLPEGQDLRTISSSHSLAEFSELSNIQEEQDSRSLSKDHFAISINAIPANPTFTEEQIKVIKSAFPSLPFSTDKSSYEACLDLLMEGVMQNLQYSCLSKYLICPTVNNVSAFLFSFFGISALIVGFIQREEIYQIIGGVALSVGVVMFMVGCILYGKYVYDATPELHNNMAGRALTSIVARDIADIKKDLTADDINDKIKQLVDKAFKGFKCGNFFFPYYPNPARLLAEVKKMLEERTSHKVDAADEIPEDQLRAVVNCVGESLQEGKE